MTNTHLALPLHLSEAYADRRKQVQHIITHFHAEGDLIYDGSRNTLKSFDVGEEAWIVKAFKAPNIVNKIVYRFFRKSKARRSFKYANRLLEKGIKTPAPVAFYENYSTLFFKDSYYISQHLKYDLTYRELIHDKNWSDREQILKEFTAFTKLIHDQGVLFKDHSPGNTLICKNADGSYEFYLVDLNRMQFKELSYEERIANFARLTPDKEMVEIMAYEYAILNGYDKEKCFEDMWRATDKFFQKHLNKRKWKRRIFFWKDKYKND